MTSAAKQYTAYAADWLLAANSTPAHKSVCKSDDGGCLCPTDHRLHASEPGLHWMTNSRACNQGAGCEAVRKAADSVLPLLNQPRVLTYHTVRML